MSAMVTAWLVGPPLAVGYGLLMLRGTSWVAQAWERRHPH
ncbi:Uncharacterised protein [Mycolicibacterium tokaiense]|jgi:hypothetical protein|uniref:Uncharacterized protein n=1 Tax=Mycolicibacterium tokaiense TaxID=39695 RepID=A0A378TE73_9MYCO|nr:Uncharacterised protein [Mycolicibacterium tokaiense]